MLSLYLIFLTCEFFLLINMVFSTDYCKLSKNHTLCGGGSIQPLCGEKNAYIYKDITDNEISAVLDAHNKYRNDLALGKVIGGHEKVFPKAANMEEMKWDSELADIAAATVKKCRPYFQNCHGCRLTDRHNSVAESKYQNSSTEPLDKLHDFPIEKVVDIWFNEKKWYDPADVPMYRSSTNSLGKAFSAHTHFTQIIWWSKFRVGCAKITFRDLTDKFNYQIIICNYAPGGNIVGSTIYDIGEPCSKCEGEGRTCSKKYEGLCAAEGRPNDPDPPTINSG